MSAAITKHEHHHLTSHDGGQRFSDDQRALIRDTCCGGASKQEADALIAIAEMRGLNPIAGECYFVQRWDSQKKRMVWAVQVSIDAMRIKAEESGVYSGQDEPEFEYEADGKTIKLARVRVYRRDWDRPCVGVARWAEYVQKTREGEVTKFWKTMPHNQLAKCAESLAIRKAFPKRFAKLYTEEEMGRADQECEEMQGEVVPHRPPSQPPPAAGPIEPRPASILNLAIADAKDLDALKDVWTRVLAHARAGKVTLSERAALQDAKEARKAELSKPVPVDYPKAADEALDGNPAPDWMGGENEGPPQPEGNCVHCGKPVDAESVPLNTSDGEIVWRHFACFGGGK